MSHREVRCSAGVNYGLIYPNGDVYRCMRDYTTRMPPIGNLLDPEFSFHDKPKSCQQRVCNAQCDADWSSKWFMTGENIDRHVKATVVRKGWCDQPLDPPVRDKVVLNWAPTLPCNYSCSYCGCAAGKTQVLRDFPSSSPELSVEQWKGIFSRLTEQFAWGQIMTNGGEPFLSDAVLPVLEQISEKYSIGVTTNASVKMYELTRSNIKPFDFDTDTGVELTASLHPTSRNFHWDKFLGTVLMLKENGFLRGVNFVGWPGQLFSFEYYRDILAKYDIELLLLNWVGMDNDGFEGYSPAEDAYVRAHTTRERIVENQIDLSGYVPKPDNAAELDVKLANPNGDGPHQHTFAVRVTNAGSNTWNPDGAGDVRLGARLFEASKGKKIAAREDRAELTGPIAAGESRDVEITVLTDEVASGDYELAFDVVHEDHYWFADLGSADFRMPLTVGQSPLRIAS